MSLPYNVGVTLYASFTATINAVTYVFNSASLTQPTNQFQVTDESNVPSGLALTAGWATGTAEIQVNASADQQDLRGYTFATTQFDGTSRTFVITDQSPSISKENVRTCSISYTEVTGLS